MFDEHTQLCLHWCHARLSAVLKLSTSAAVVPVVTQAFKQLWATPRQSVRFPSRTVTERTLSDLPTQLAFEKHTPKGNRLVNPRFVEQLMGYPKDWTKF